MLFSSFPVGLGMAGEVAVKMGGAKKPATETRTHDLRRLAGTQVNVNIKISKFISQDSADTKFRSQH
jgi:hypothetical protein